MTDKIYVKQLSKKHRGVFAKTNIKKGETIETCPVLIIPLKDKKLIDKTFTFNYYFHWGRQNQPAIALGYGSLYNHSYNPNADYSENIKKQVIIFKAIKNIKKDEEIRTNYNGNSDDKSPLWFKVKNM
jgi:uncharacterized protein